MMISVSVIIPVYNGGKYLNETLNRLHCVEMKDIEFICIDDQSTDNSYLICKNYADNDSRFKLFKKKNEGGVYATRNFGLEKVQGDYICFCDQDDIIELDMYKKMYMKAKMNNADIVMCSTGKLINNKKEPFETLTNKTVLKGEDTKELILSNLFINTDIYPHKSTRIGNTIWKCMIKRDLIKKSNIKFHRIVNYEDDWLFLLSTIANANKIITLSDIYYYWRVNLQSETYTTKYVDDMYKKSLELQRELEDIMKTAQIPEEWIEKYHLHYNCCRYVDLIENEIRDNSKSLSEKIQIIKQIENEKDFTESLIIRNYYHKNLFRKKECLRLLSQGQIKAAYLFLLMFDSLRNKALNFKWWTVLERKISS